MELCGSKVQPQHGNFISGVANPEIVYMLIRFQVISIDGFLFLKKTLFLIEHLLNFKSKVSEFLLTKQNKPMLNKHGTSISLKLFN